MNRNAVALIGMLLLAPGCADSGAQLEVELTTSVIPATEVDADPQPRVESGFHEITVRQVFTARGPCRELDALLTRDYSEGFLLRIEAKEREGPCEEDSPHLLYAAVLRGLPEGTHPLRVVHVGADGRTLNETVLAHPVLVTAAPR
ncbi:MAG: hypothetical protein EA350_15445 [Gemmatimonadales bacterium]|nr:MAG: hypothetical protein EA350_15445 [Gemmatimonadales bacterium]